MKPQPTLALGASLPLHGRGPSKRVEMPAQHLVTHGVVLGMTGSGKTGLLTVAVEEALRNEIPVLMVDVKGDLPNLLLAFPDFQAARLVPWMEGEDEAERTERAAAAAQARETALRAWGITEAELADFSARTALRVITPGSTAGEPLHVLSSLEQRSPLWDEDPEAARQLTSAAVSLVLRLLGRDPDPAKSREHVLLSVLAEARLSQGENADLATLLTDITEPTLTEVGALPLDEFISKADRRALAAALNTLLASPTFRTWRQGAQLNVAEWLTPKDGRTPATIVSVAHLDDEERALVLGIVLEEVLAWMRSLHGSQRLKALVVFDEVYGFLPPHPHNPPTKRPLVALMKQARAFGVGVLLATQNPMDLDYRALSNAGVWIIGRLQTDADRARVVDGMCTSAAGHKGEAAQLAATLKRLTPRWFVMRDAHSEEGSVFLQPRWAMSYLAGPMTRVDLRTAMRARHRTHTMGCKNPFLEYDGGA